MTSRIGRFLSYANVMSTLAVVVALGGTSYAALTLPKNSVRTKNLANGSVTTNKLARGSVTTVKLARGAVTSVKLANNAVTAANVKNGTLLAADFKSGELPAKHDSGPPTGAAGGDLTGAYPNPQVRVTLPAVTALTPGTNWTLTTTDGQPGLSCYQDREGIVHFVGGFHSNLSAATTVATLPSACPPPANDIVVEALGNLASPTVAGLTSDPYVIPITVGHDGKLTNPGGTAGNGSANKNNLSMDSITYRAR